MKRLIRKIKDKFYSKSITRRIILVIAVLSIITTIVFVSSVFIILRNQLINRTRTNSEKNIVMVLEKVDMFFQGVRNDSVSVLVGESCQTILSNTDDFLSSNSIKQHMKYKLMQEVINRNINQKSMYHTIVFYDLKGNYYGDENMIVSETYVTRQVERIMNFLDSTDKESILSTHKSPWRKKRDSESSDCISYLRKVYSKESGKLIGIVEFEITNEEIEKLYSTVMTNGIDIFFTNQGQVILSKNKEYLYKNLSQERWYQKIEDKEQEKGFLTISNNSTLYCTKEYEELNWRIVCAVPKSEYMRDIQIYALIMVVAGILLFVGSLYIINILIVSITKPLRKITNTIVDIGKGDLQQRVSVKDGGEIGTLAVEFNRMLDKTETLMVEIVEKEEEKRESELSLFQMQMIPHFFYNILESICGLITMNEKKLAIHTINLLSGFYRGVLNKGEEIITIEQEIGIALNYLEIMKICHPNKFTYEIICPENLKKNCINKLTLQPVLENSVHHGFYGISSSGSIKINVYEKEGNVILEISDNGKGIGEYKRQEILQEVLNDGGKRFETENFGLRNTDERVKLYFGNNYGIDILKQEIGTKIRIELPRMDK